MKHAARIAVLIQDAAVDIDTLQDLGDRQEPPLEFVVLNGPFQVRVAEIVHAGYDAVVASCQSVEAAGALAALVAGGYNGALIAVGPDNAKVAGAAQANGAVEYLVQNEGYWHTLPYAVKSALFARELHAIAAFKDQFISIASHELKNPLAAMRGYAELLLRRLQREQSDERSLRGLGVIIQQSLRMQHILDDLHDLSRLNRGLLQLHVGTIGLRELLDRASAGIVAEGEMPPIELPDIALALQIEGDVERLVQAVTRVLTTVAVHSYQAVPVQVIVEELDEGLAVRIDVCGQSGLKAEDLHAAFTHFYTSSSASRISATERLGLYVAAQVFNLHDGSIEFDTSPTGESVFSITLPLVRNRSRTAERT